ncbi:hypothetical protein A6R68_03723 [Neotoma lepida]|uniref:Uncharacterized protein n=1 Tax=Neotoma lepida TaxID=56216 RepID=A0A1A6GNF7_NEOLE|nr:hypothetical protein A6R68_03723 [Neotoma lepida]
MKTKFLRTRVTNSETADSQKF